MSRTTVLQLFLLLVLIACLAACNDSSEVRSDRENSSYYPREAPDAEYPGTKEHDSLKKNSPDATLPNTNDSIK
jgi:hypothetical protein